MSEMWEFLNSSEVRMKFINGLANVVVFLVGGFILLEMFSEWYNHLNWHNF